jgi:hypothetical protein
MQDKNNLTGSNSNKSKLLFFIFIFVAFCSNAQMSVFPKSVGIRAGYGFIIPHSSNIEPLIKGHISSFEINYRYNFSGVKEWEKTYRYPYSGIALHYMNFNNDDAGSAISILPYFAFPIKKNKVLDAHFRVATGLTYITNKFDLLENRKNQMTGSTINAGVDLMLQANWKIDRKIHFLTGISLTHYSNGAFSLPNTGINVVSINSGLTLNIGDPVAVNHNKFPILRRTLKWIAWGGFWLKEVGQVNGAKYAIVKRIETHVLVKVLFQVFFSVLVDRPNDNNVEEQADHTSYRYEHEFHKILK